MRYGKPTALADDLAKTLDWLNDWRKARGLEPLSEIEKGHPRRLSMCPLSRSMQKGYEPMVTVGRDEWRQWRARRVQGTREVVPDLSIEGESGSLPVFVERVREAIDSGAKVTRHLIE